MRVDDVFLFCSAKRNDLESEEMINMEDLWLAIMFMTRSIAAISALESDDSFRRCFSNF